MQISRFYFLLKLFSLFVALVIAEYLACSACFRFVRQSDFLTVDWICGISSLILCYLIFRNLIKDAFKEQIPFLAVALFFLFFSSLIGFFLRYSLQLANGLLDFSNPKPISSRSTQKKSRHSAEASRRESIPWPT